MKNLSTKTKILIGAGIVLAIFIIFLFILAGSSGNDKVPNEDNLKQNITGITCETQTQGNFDYDISLITNDTQFDDQISSRKYTRIVINHTQDLKSYGLGFTVRSDESADLTFTLMKNDEVLKSDTLSLLSRQVATVNLSLENPIEISVSDNFYIEVTLSEDTTFAVDTFLFFMDLEA